jgi:hypothetical protein
LSRFKLGGAHIDGGRADLAVLEKQLKLFDTAESFNRNFIFIDHIIVIKVFSYASYSVAAHFAFAAVKIEHTHFRVGSIGRTNQNDAIAADAVINCEELTVDEARERGAIGLFGNKYGERVKVYTMGPFSKEICGGPHAARTGELGHFSITKEQASSAGVRRIRAQLEQK